MTTFTDKAKARIIKQSGRRFAVCKEDGHVHACFAEQKDADNFVDGMLAAYGSSWLVVDTINL